MSMSTPLPIPSVRPKISKALNVYRVLAWITGMFLLLLVVEMILKYGFSLEFTLNYNDQFISLIPSAVLQDSGLVNLSVVIQITHGYIYIAYLISAFLLVNWIRWPIRKFVLIALGGVVPLLSFFVEHRVNLQVKDILARAEESDNAPDVKDSPATS